MVVFPNIFASFPPDFFTPHFSKTKKLEELLKQRALDHQIILFNEVFSFCLICLLEFIFFCVVLSMEEHFDDQNRSIGGRKRSCSSQNCIHCLKPLSKRRILQHQSRCPAAKLSLPDGFKVEVVSGKTVYCCQCGYRGQRCRVLNHIEKCVNNKEAIASTNLMSSVAELEEYRHSGHFEPLPEAQLAPIVVAPVQSVSMTIEEIEAEEDNNVKYFDPHIHPRFSQFRQPKEDAPIPSLQNRYKIFSISLLLRLTGSFLPNLKVWAGNRC